MAENSCFPSGWCDLSSEHRSVRERVERLIENALKMENYKLIVVVAPYGSGKTTLLRHAEWYARERLGVPAKLVELRQLVDYITERRGFIHESELPQVVEEFAAEVTGSRRSVLLIDEVEESYDILSGLVEHETSPFRGLADAAMRGRIKTIVVLAFGPSSAFKEALFGPVAWRSTIIGLPIIGVETVKSMLRAHDVDGELLEVLAPAAWWMSRGRVAWASYVVEHVVPELLKAVESGKLADLLSSNTLRVEVSDGVPLLDLNGVNELLSSAGFEAAPLSLIPTPTPLTLFTRLVGGTRPLQSPSVVAARAAVRIDELVEKMHSFLTAIARRSGIEESTVVKAVDVVAKTASAWSYRGLLPYDIQSLRSLLAVAADIAREVYADDPKAAKLVSSGEAILATLSVESLDEPLVALKPDMIAKIYPPAGTPPVFGCARIVGLAKARETVGNLTIEDLYTVSSQVAETLELKHVLEKLGYKAVVFIPSSLHSDEWSKIACRALRDRAVVVTAKPPPEPLRVAEKLGLTLVVEVGERLEASIVSALYAETVSGECSIRSLKGVDARSVSKLREELRAAIVERAAEAIDHKLVETYGKLTALAQSIGVENPILLAKDVEKLGETVKLVESLEETLRDIGVQMPRLSQHLYSLASSINKIYGELRRAGIESLESLLTQCGLKQVKESERYHIPTSIELDWLPEKIRGKVERLIEESRLLAEKSAPTSPTSIVTAPILSTVESLVTKIAEAKDKLDSIKAKVKQLPEPISTKLLARLDETIESLETLTDLVNTIERWHSELKSVEDRLEAINRLVGVRRELVRRIRETIDAILSTLNMAGEVVSSEAEAGA